MLKIFYKLMRCCHLIGVKNVLLTALLFFLGKCYFAHGKDEVEKKCLFPVFEYEKTDSSLDWWLRPFAWQSENFSNKEKNAYFLPPLGFEHKDEKFHKWDLFGGIINHSKTLPSEGEKTTKYFNIMPFWFSRYGGDPKKDYKALFPLCGRVKNIFWRDEIEWFMWPLWLKTKKGEKTSKWTPFPIVNRRSGKDCGGLGILPIGGHFWTKDTDEEFCLWPLIYRNKNKKNNHIKKGFLPFYAYEKSDNVEDLSIIWPIWGNRVEKSPAYKENRILWPLWVQGRGQKVYINRWAPFYTHSKKNGLDKKWFLWPLLKVSDTEDAKMFFHKEQLLYFLVWTEKQTSKYSDFFAEKTHVWPFCSYMADYYGEVQFQMFSPFEVFFPMNKAIRTMYSPLFAIYRYHKLPCGDTFQRLFYFIKSEKNKKGKSLDIGFLLRYRSFPGDVKLEFLKGFFEYSKKNGKRVLKLLWFKLEGNIEEKGKNLPKKTKKKKRRNTLRRL